VLRSVGESKDGILEEERPPRYGDFEEAGRVRASGRSDVTGDGEGNDVEKVSLFTHKSVRVLGIPVMSSKQTVTVVGKDIGVEFVEDERTRR
jgi:hypothetical protein